MRNTCCIAKLGTRDCQTFYRAGFSNMLLYVWIMKCGKSCKPTMFIDWRSAGDTVVNLEGKLNSIAGGDVSLKDKGLLSWGFLLVIIQVYQDMAVG